VLDSYTSIGLTAAFVPFSSSYRGFWLGLGAIALDLLLAVTVTSLFRDRMSYRVWRAVHWLSYAAWPIALLHGFGTGSDVKSGWLQLLSVVCVLAVLAALFARSFHVGKAGDGGRAKLVVNLILGVNRLALAEGAGFGLGGMITVIPDTGLLTAITLRLIQRLCLLYGFEQRGVDDRMELWLAAATATGVDYGKDLVEKQMFEKVAPKIAGRLATKLGAEAAEKWVGRMIPLASSAIGGAMNFSFVRTWGWRVQKNLRERHIASRAASARPAYTATGTPRPVLV